MTFTETKRGFFSKQRLQFALKLFLVIQITLSYFGAFNISNAQIIAPLNTNTTQSSTAPSYIGKGVEGSIREYLCTPDGMDAGVALYQCISKVYRFGVAFGAIALVFFLVFAGYMYITGGESGKQKGKSMFLSAITGMVIILSSYVLLGFINPELTKIKPIQPPIFTANDLPSCTDVGLGVTCVLPDGQVSTGGTVSGSGDCTAAGYTPAKDACGGDPANLCKANYPNNRCKADVVARCNSSEYQGYFTAGINMYNSHGGKGIAGVNMMSLVKSIASVERNCTKTGICSGAGACGMMQFIPGSARLFAPKCGASVGNWPEWANENPAIQICMAAFHLEENVKSCGNQVRNIAAGYNAGAGNCARNTSSGCNVSSPDGTTPLRKWECKCGRSDSNYNETTTYGPAVAGCYYNAFK